MNLVTTLEPLAEPISLAEAKNHLKVTDTAQDILIGGLITTARRNAEVFTRRAFVTRTNVLRLDGFPCGTITLPDSSPLRSLSSIAYVDQNGDTQTWSSDLYQVDLYGDPGRIRPAYGQVYPATREQMNAVTVTYKCGYATKFTAATDDTITASGHCLADGDVAQLYYSGPEGGALPAGLSEATNYYARDVVAGTSLKLSATSGGSAVDVTGTGTGTGAQFYLGVVPRDIRAAMLLMLTDWFEHRKEVITGTIVAELPRGVEDLLAPYRVLQL